MPWNGNIIAVVGGRFGVDTGQIAIDCDPIVMSFTENQGWASWIDFWPARGTTPAAITNGWGVGGGIAVPELTWVPGYFVFWRNLLPQDTNCQWLSGSENYRSTQPAGTSSPLLPDPSGYPTAADIDNDWEFRLVYSSGTDKIQTGGELASLSTWYGSGNTDTSLRQPRWRYALTGAEAPGSYTADYTIEIRDAATMTLQDSATVRFSWTVL